MQGDADTHEADGLMGGVGDTAPLTPAENEPADIEGGYPSQGTSALEAEAKAKIKSLALQGAEDKAKLVPEPAGAYTGLSFQSFALWSFALWIVLARGNLSVSFRTNINYY